MGETLESNKTRPASPTLVVEHAAPGAAETNTLDDEEVGRHGQVGAEDEGEDDVDDAAPEVTTAVTRSLRHLDVAQWLTCIAASAAVRTALQHPITVATARKRVHEGFVPLKDVLRDLYANPDGKQSHQTAKSQTTQGNAGVKGSSAAPHSSNNTAASSSSRAAAQGKSDGSSSTVNDGKNEKGAKGTSGSRRSRRGGFRAFLSSKRVRGVRSLYRGLGVAMVGNVIGECSYLGVLEVFREHFPADTSAVRDAAGGACGDAAALALCTPLSVIVNRQMTAGFGLAAENKYTTMRGTALDVARTSSAGWRGLYAGFVASLYMLPASAVWWSTYGLTKTVLYGTMERWTVRASTVTYACTCAEETTTAADAAAARKRCAACMSQRTPAGLLSSPLNGEDVTVAPQSNGAFSMVAAAVTSTRDNPLLNGCAGVVASLIATLAFSPFMVLRMRMQVLPGGPSRGRLRWAAGELWRQDGWRGFFKGAGANCAVAVGDGLVFSSVYELTKWLSDTTGVWA